jgi:ATP-binding cassette subfamily D (ALD) protein 3
MDVEDLLYTYCNELGITLFTISHRPSLFKHHDYVLRFDGEGGWSFNQVEKQIEIPKNKNTNKKMGSYKNIDAFMN